MPILERLGQHNILITKTEDEFEGSHGRTSTRVTLHLRCSCGWTKSVGRGCENEIARKITAHKIDVLLEVAGITFAVDRKDT